MRSRIGLSSPAKSPRWLHADPAFVILSLSGNLPPDEIQALVDKIQDKRAFFIRASGAVNKFSRSFVESMMPDEVKRTARKNEANVEFDQEDWDIQEDSATVMLVARGALSESRMRLAFVRIDERWYIQ